MPYKNKADYDRYQADYRRKDRARLLEQYRQYNIKNRDHIREKAREKYYKDVNESRRKDREYRRKPYALNPEKKKSYSKAWRERNPVKARKMYRDAGIRYYKRNRESVLARKRARKKQRWRTDPNYKLLECLRSRLHMALKGRVKSESSKTLLGCSLNDLWIYLESKFEPGMTRENYGKVWHIDHIMPCAIFDLSKPEHQKRCFHFSNLQPLFGKENLRKSAKVLSDQFQLL